MISILRTYIEGDNKVTEYTKDGANVSHIVKEAIQTEPIEPVETQPTLEEITMQTQLNTEYLVCLAELNNI